MTLSDNFLAHWYYHLPNLAMAAMIYTIIGRYVLELVFDMVGGRQDAVILNVFRGITDPIAKLVRAITPAVVPNGLCLILSIVWLMAMRMGWFLTCVAFGMRPNIAG